LYIREKKEHLEQLKRIRDLGFHITDLISRKCILQSHPNSSQCTTMRVACCQCVCSNTWVLAKCIWCCLTSSQK